MDGLGNFVYFPDMARERYPLISPQDELHVRLFTVGIVPIDATWNASNVYSSFWRLYVNNRDGAAVRLADGEVFALRAGRTHIVPAWVRFHCQCTRAIDHAYVHFEVMGLPPTLVRQVFDRPMTLAGGAALQRWIEPLRAGSALDLAALCRTKVLLFEALGALMERLPREQQARCARHLMGRHAVTAAIEYVEEHLHENVSNARLAEVCGVGEGHFIRLFRRCMGQTPAQYTLDRRISRAAQRLIFGADKIERIAEACGFTDRFYFSRVFAARMGLPPAAYRKTSRV